MLIVKDLFYFITHGNTSWEGPFYSESIANHTNKKDNKLCLSVIREILHV